MMFRNFILAALWPLVHSFSITNSRDWKGDIGLNVSNPDSYVNATGLSLGWAKFCDDEECNGCGINVALSNPGCLNQMNRNRKSIHFKDMTWLEGETLFLLAGTTANCSCIAECMVITAPMAAHTPYCWKIPEEMRYDSYRFTKADWPGADGKGLGSCPEENQCVKKQPLSSTVTVTKPGTTETKFKTKTRMSATTTHATTTATRTKTKTRTETETWWPTWWPTTSCNGTITATLNVTKATTQTTTVTQNATVTAPKVFISWDKTMTKTMTATDTRKTTETMTATSTQTETDTQNLTETIKTTDTKTATETQTKTDTKTLIETRKTTETMRTATETATQTEKTTETVKITETDKTTETQTATVTPPQQITATLTFTYTDPRVTVVPTFLSNCTTIGTSTACVTFPANVTTSYPYVAVKTVETLLLSTDGSSTAGDED
ncbi:hypothetical protein F5Y18DRAFT_438285 [Xylariaceae sp. FL1019]|nr:hypothetical protein F5Y18DRAFT_438285 [Xylariaceae sp. FL1019]